MSERILGEYLDKFAEEDTIIKDSSEVISKKELLI